MATPLKILFADDDLKYSLLEAHHGQVSLRSEVGKGTEVTVGLPI